MREARNAAQLRTRPNIVAVHDVVVEGNVPWIVMELVSGHTLADEIRAHGRLPVGRVRTIAAGVLSALEAAHSADIVHRDVKPSNVLLADDGRILLADFGLAVHESDTRITSSGVLIGSLDYVAPERIERGSDGPAGDLFSLGVTLYHAVEGFSPFQRDTPKASLAAVVAHHPEPPQHAEELADLIVRLLAKDLADRPTAQAALAELTPRTPKASAPTRTVTAASRPDTSPATRRGPSEKPRPGLRHGAVGAGPAAALCAVIQVRTTYALVGVSGGSYKLHDNGSDLAFNISLITIVIAGSLLVAMRRSARLGLWICAVSGLLYPATYIQDWVSALRSGPSGAQDFYAPAPGFYWGIASAVLTTAGAVVAVMSLKRTGDLRFRVTWASAGWAGLSVICAGAWIIGRWLPWQEDIVTVRLAENGATRTTRLDSCCLVSDYPAQWAAQVIVLTVLIAGIGLLAAWACSTDSAVGMLSGACAYTALGPVAELFRDPYTLAQAATRMHTTEDALQQANGLVALHALPGLWIATAATVGLLLLIVAAWFTTRTAWARPRQTVGSSG